MWTYPASDLDRSRQLLALTGSFWSSVYTGRDTIEAVIKARADVEAQNYINLDEALQSRSRSEVPVFHRQNWRMVVLRQSDKGKYFPRYGDDLVFGQAGLVYGEPLTLSNLPAWELPENLVSVPLIFNRLASPSVAWSAGMDFTLDRKRNLLVFREDPFENGNFGTSPVFGPDGAQTDTELFLWLFHSEFDRQHIYRNWGYVLGLSLPSSETYRDLVNILLDGTAGGTGFAQIRSTYSAMTGLPLVRTASETVEWITTDTTHQIVITDVGVYRLPLGATLTVSEGDVLHKGDTLTTGLQFAELNRGMTPEWVRALGVGSGLLVGQYHSELIFENTSYPLTISSDADGRTRIEFPVGGFPLDVAAFWNDVHNRGVADGQTLANLLDTRTAPTGEPAASNLPATINPAAFLIENVFRSNMALVRIRMAEIDPSAIGLSPAHLVREILNPGSAVIVLVEVSPPADSVILDSESSSTNPGGSSSIGSFAGAATVLETVGPGSLSHHVAAWPVSGSCQ